MVGTDDGAHVFRFKLRRHRGRADEIAEHDRDLPALGGIAHRLRRRRCWQLIQGRDCLEKPLAMSERNPELFEIGFRQISQNIGLDCVISERRLVLAKSKASQPIGDIHRDVRPTSENCGVF
jgi:hypothetical protein